MKYKYNGQWVDINIKALDSMPLGSIILFAGTDIPTGWMLCDGTSLSEEEYPALFDKIGYTYGGSGTSFNLPNFKGRVGVGKDTSQSYCDNLGETGGSVELQSHFHTAGTYDNYTINNTSATAGGTANALTIDVSSTTSSTRIKTNSAGTGNSGNLQPYIVVNYIIKVLDTTPTMASVVDAYSTSTQDAYSCSYVNKNLTYSTDEIDTGKVWYDNKKIYRKVIPLQSLVDAVENTWTTITSVSGLNISTLTDCKLISNNGCVWTGYLTRISSNNLQVYNGITTWAVLKIVIEYTKSS